MRTLISERYSRGGVSGGILKYMYLSPDITVSGKMLNAVTKRASDIHTKGVDTCGRNDDESISIATRDIAQCFSFEYSVRFVSWQAP